MFISVSCLVVYALFTVNVVYAPFYIFIALGAAAPLSLFPFACAFFFYTLLLYYMQIHIPSIRNAW